MEEENSLYGFYQKYGAISNNRFNFADKIWVDGEENLRITNGGTSLYLPSSGNSDGKPKITTSRRFDISASGEMNLHSNKEARLSAGDYYDNYISLQEDNLNIRTDHGSYRTQGNNVISSTGGHVLLEAPQGSIKLTARDELLLKVIIEDNSGVEWTDEVFYVYPYHYNSPNYFPALATVTACESICVLQSSGGLKKMSKADLKAWLNS